MKKYFGIIGYCLTPFVMSYAFWYCVGAGISASWDTANWTMDLKVVLSLWANASGFALYYRIEQEYN
jgi:hypothetical protein